MRMKLWIGVSLLAAVVWTGAALGGVLAGDSAATAPANDNFANALVLPGASTTRLGDTNVDATLELDEPDTVADGPAANSVWYFWTAPANGMVVIDLKTSDYDTLLAAYTGNAVNALTEVASNDDFGEGNQSRVRFPAASGTVYRIRVDGYDGDTGTINLALHQDPPPANDNFASATVLSGATTSRTRRHERRRDARGGRGRQRRGHHRRSICLVHVDGAGERADDDRHGDEQLQHAARRLHRASVGALTEVASNDDWQTELTSQVTFAATWGRSTASESTASRPTPARSTSISTTCCRRRTTTSRTPSG